MYTQREKQNGWLDETVGDVTRLHSTQHDVQENTSETNDIHLSKRKRKTSDHRCAIATVTINMLEKNIHIKNTRTHDTTEHDEREQAKQNIKVVKLELEKYKEIIEKIIKKERHHKKMPQRKQKVKQGKHKRKRKTQQQQQEQFAKMLKRKQKKTKDCAKETWRATVWWQRMKMMDGIVDVPLSPLQTKTKSTLNSTTIMSSMTWTKTQKSENSADAAGEEHLDRDTVNDDAVIVETAREVGRRHRGRLVLRIVKEEDDFTKFHNDHVHNNMVDGLERNQAQSRRSESSSTETMSDVAVTTARMPGEEHSDRNTAKVETDRFQGDGHHARFPPSVIEARSKMLHVSNSMNEV